MRQPVIFLDRDGTLVHPRPYPSHPSDLVLYDGLGQGLRTLQRAGFALIVVTNQAGVARGYFTATALDAMHVHLTCAFALLGVRLDDIYHCPHHVDGVVPELAIACACRKPQPGLLLRAAAEHDLDLSHAWMVGDILDDVEAGRRAGCQTILVDLDTERPPTSPVRTPDFVARATPHALRIIAAVEGLGGAPELHYLPLSWRLTQPATKADYVAQPELTAPSETGDAHDIRC